MRIFVIGSLGYHDDTIVKPIVEEIQSRRYAEVVDVYKGIAYSKGALVHVPGNMYNAVRYWATLTCDFLCKSAMNDGDVVLVTDFWNPVIFNIRMIVASKKINCRFYAIHHGSSQLPGDFASQPEYKFANAYEWAWARSYDKIFLASRWVETWMLKHAIPNTMVTGLPIKHINMKYGSMAMDWNFRDIDCIMPLRMDWDKGSDRFIEFVLNNPGYSFISFANGIPELGLPRNLTVNPIQSREALLGYMNRSKYVVSCARQETFGYAVLEAAAEGCKPILLWDNNCYSELFPSSCFVDLNDCQINQHDHLNYYTKVDAGALLMRLAGAEKRIVDVLMGEQNG